METKVENGITYQKVTHPTRTCLTGPEWLMEMFDGAKNGNNMLKPTRDANGLPIIGKQVLDDPTWDRFGNLPNGKRVRDYLEEIPHTYWEPIDETNE